LKNETQRSRDVGFHSSTQPTNLFTIHHPLIMQTYYYLAASQQFLHEQEVNEVFTERVLNYQEQGKELDFWLIDRPAFLDAPELASVKAKIPQPATGVVSTNKQFITWLKLRLEFVATGEFQAPSATIPDPIGILTTA
jgi:Protein of unknown function (DUF2488)